MRKVIFPLIVTLLIFVFCLYNPKWVYGQIIEPHSGCGAGGACWPTRQINEYSCTECQNQGFHCTDPNGRDCEYRSGAAQWMCNVGSACFWSCPDTTQEIHRCEVWDVYVNCNHRNEPSCHFDGISWECTVPCFDCGCTGIPTNSEWGCCGPGSSSPPPPGQPPGNPPSGGCTIELSNITVVAGTPPTTIIPSVTEDGGNPITSIDFYTSLANIATVTDDNNRADGWQTLVTGIAPGTTVWGATATTQDGKFCSSKPAMITVTNPPAWWQVVGGDIVAATGNITSVIPYTTTCVLPTCVNYLIRNNTAGYSGVPSAGGLINVGYGTVNQSNWIATNADYLGTESYNYAYYEKKIPASVTPTHVTGPTYNGDNFESGGASYGGYIWYMYNGAAGNININAGDGVINVGTRKVVFFVKNVNVTFSAKINSTNGQGGFYVFADKDINISYTIGDGPEGADALDPVADPDIKAFLFADGQIRTGHNTAEVDKDLQLYIRGGLVGFGLDAAGVPVNQGIVLERQLPNNALYPGEVIEFAPDMALLFPSQLVNKNINWRETSP